MVLRSAEALLRRGVAAVCVVGLGSAVQLHAATPIGSQEELLRKPAWQWTAEERIAERLQPTKVAARAAANEAARLDPARVAAWKALGVHPGAERSDGVLRDALEGRHNPELFLPSEIFGTLLRRAFLLPLESRMVHRGAIESRSVALGFGEDLWDRLREIAREPLEWESRQLRQMSAGHAPPEVSRPKAVSPCFARFLALEAAKDEFGEERFLRFLYEAVAPDISTRYTVDADTAEQLLYMERGCLGCAVRRHVTGDRPHCSAKPRAPTTSAKMQAR